MKTLPLLVCICALSACLSLSEGRRYGSKVHQRKKMPLQSYYYRGYFHKNHGRFHPNERYHNLHNGIRKPSHNHKPQKCPVKNNTVINNSTSETTTQVPPVTSTTKAYPTPNVTPLPQEYSTTFTEGNVTNGSSVTTISQPNPTPQETSAAQSISSAITQPQSSPSSPDNSTIPDTIPSLPQNTPAPEPYETTDAQGNPTAAPATTQITKTLRKQFIDTLNEILGALEKGWEAFSQALQDSKNQ